MTDAQNIAFNALRNAMYHTARRSFYERINLFCSFMIVVLVASAINDSVNIFGVAPYMIGIAITIIGSAQLVFDFGGKASTHQVLQREYYRLMADIKAALNPSPDMIAAWNGRMLLIAADEPPVLRAIDAKAYNDALDALETFPQDQRVLVPFLHRVFGSFITFDGHNYRKIAEQAG